MPIPVIGAVSEPEAIGLGKLFEAYAKKQTGTLINGNDVAPDIDDNSCGRLRRFFISRTGPLVIAKRCKMYRCLARLLHAALLKLQLAQFRHSCHWQECNDVLPKVYEVYSWCHVTEQPTRAITTKQVFGNRNPVYLCRRHDSTGNNRWYASLRLCM